MCPLHSLNRTQSLRMAGYIQVIRGQDFKRIEVNIPWPKFTGRAVSKTDGGGKKGVGYIAGISIAMCGLLR